MGTSVSPWTEGDQLAADAVYDTKKSGTVYATVYDAAGNDAVVEITSIQDSVAGTPGWGTSGPARPAAASQPLAMLPDAGWCGTGITGAGQGLTLVHFSAQLERFLWDRGCSQGLSSPC
jgi:hypothetical protein